MSKNLLQRIIVALIGIPAVVWICYQSGDWLRGFLLLVTGLGAYEYIRVVFRRREAPCRQGIASPLGALAWAITIVIAALHLWVGMSSALVALVVALLLLGMAQTLGKQTPEVLFGELCELSWGVFSISMLYPFMFHLREFSSVDGFHWIIALLAIIWISDTAAMGVGMAIGKHKLAPTVSPNKTVEGFLGGIVSAGITGYVLQLAVFPDDSVLVIVGAAFLISLVGQLGDLVESLWKRSVGVKDSSTIIPGHGGVLDRFDSLAFAAPALYGYLIIMFNK